MKAKFLTVTDTGTLCHYLVLQFEGVDKAFAKAAGLSTDLKILLSFSSGAVSCLAGYEFGGTFDALSAPVFRHGTIHAVKEILHHVEDIRTLPDVLDVEAFRQGRNLLRHRPIVSEGIAELLEEYDSGPLRKVLYQWGNMPHLAVVHVETRAVLFDLASTSLALLQAEYLWVPLNPATLDDLEHIDLCPFRYKLI